MKSVNIIFSGLFILTTLTACPRAHTVIAVNNHSDYTISNLVIDGSCGTWRTNRIDSMNQWITDVFYCGDAPVFLTFEHNQKQYSANSLYYIEGGISFVIEFTVNSNMEVSRNIKQKLKTKRGWRELEFESTNNSQK